MDSAACSHLLFFYMHCNNNDFKKKVLNLEGCEFGKDMDMEG